MEIRYLLPLVLGLIMIMGSFVICNLVVKSRGGLVAMIFIIILGIGITLIAGACYTAGYTKGEKDDRSNLIKICP